ncbi:cytochrome c oxidase subunit IV [Panacagrimonas perspica]|uniref:Cytochrome c oxidase subunit IV n=1 Tax=Panacagrimonas perspica TaxID=381431 RepID=A0A4S3JZQ5_9GAMM|nr:cytochrome C oxidase subunit IV family protein [Panacagrimonas perspica]TDU32809.1 cytochrome c oxidase subunit IV [Panacagrimonas perspica]THD00924.1 hypothetical protein B1810_21930 [Panacagrimonas perspica]
MNVRTAGTRTLHLTWAALILATLFGVGTAQLLGHPLLAAAAIMVVAGGKIFLILRNFMELHQGPLAYRLFFASWIVACVVGISASFAFSLFNTSARASTGLLNSSSAPQGDGTPVSAPRSNGSGPGLKAD